MRQLPVTQGESKAHHTAKSGWMSKKTMKRLFIGAAGGLVLVLGVAMIVLPGPAVAVIPVGLTILGKEFAWAKRWLENMKACMLNLKNRLHRR